MNREFGVGNESSSRGTEFKRNRVHEKWSSRRTAFMRNGVHEEQIARITEFTRVQLGKRIHPVADRVIPSTRRVKEELMV